MPINNQGTNQAGGPKYTLTEVDYDPFAAPATPSEKPKYTLTEVDYDPFATKAQVKPASVPQGIWDKIKGKSGTPAPEIDFEDLIPKNAAAKGGPEIDFEDLIPQGAQAQGKPDINFDDLIPATKPKPSSVPQGIWDKIKNAASQGKENLKKELADPVGAMAKQALGLGKGLVDIVDGGTQIGLHNVSAIANWVAPDSKAAAFLNDVKQQKDRASQNLEDAYQKATDGSVMAGVGRVAGNAAVPLGALSKGSTAVSLGGKVLKAGAVGGATASLVPVYDLDENDPNAFAKAKASQVATGTAFGGALPVAGQAAVRAGAAVGIKPAQQVLTKQRADKLFGNSPSGAVDAEAILDLAKQRQLSPGSVTSPEEIAKQYLRNTQIQLEKAGLMSDEVAQVISGRKALSAVDPAILGKLQATQEGKATLAMIEKANRTEALAKGTQQDSGKGVLSGVIDAGVSAVTGVPAPVLSLKRAVVNAWGGATGQKTVENLTSPKNVTAAEFFLSKNGPSEASQAYGDLVKAADAKTSRNALEQAMQAQKAREAEEALGALKMTSRRVSGTPGGGAYQALLEHTGLAKDDLNKALRIAENIPSARDAVRAIRVNGGNTAPDAIYPVTDIIKSIADDMGFQRVGQSRGVLDQRLPPGALTDYSGSPVRSPSLYSAKIKAVQDGYIQDAQRLSASSLPAPAKATALEVNKLLSTTGDNTKRHEAILGMLRKHPENASELLSVFKQYMR